MSVKDLWAAYLSTELHVTLPDGSVRRVTQTRHQTPQPWPFDANNAWVLTACNPRSIELPSDENGRRHQALGDWLKLEGFKAFPNVGMDPRNPEWVEPGYTILDIEEAAAVELGREWEQNAIFGWSPDKWELVGVLIEARNTHGWRWLSGEVPA